MYVIYYIVDQLKDFTTIHQVKNFFFLSPKLCSTVPENQRSNSLRMDGWWTKEQKNIFQNLVTSWFVFITYMYVNILSKLKIIIMHIHSVELTLGSQFIT